MKHIKVRPIPLNLSPIFLAKRQQHGNNLPRFQLREIQNGNRVKRSKWKAHSFICHLQPEEGKRDQPETRVLRRGKDLPI